MARAAPRPAAPASAHARRGGQCAWRRPPGPPPAQPPMAPADRRQQQGKHRAPAAESASAEDTAAAPRAPGPGSPGTGANLKIPGPFGRLKRLGGQGNRISHGEPTEGLIRRRDSSARAARSQSPQAAACLASDSGSDESAGQRRAGGKPAGWAPGWWRTGPHGSGRWRIRSRVRRPPAAVLAGLVHRAAKAAAGGTPGDGHRDRVDRRAQNGRDAQQVLGLGT